MNDFLNTVMNFINENTTLLIIICVFLIFVLVGYLIDNSVKSRKMAKKRELEGNTGVVVEETTIQEPVVQPIEQNVETQVEKPVINSIEEDVQPIVEPIIPEPVQPKPVEDTVEEESNNYIEANDSEPLDEIKTTTFDDIDYEEPNVEFTPDVVVDDVEPSTVSTDEISEPTSVAANEISIDPAINDLLNKDFTQETENVDNIEESPSISKLDEMLLNPSKPVVTKIEDEKPSEETSKYKNSKSLAEILGSKNKEIQSNPILQEAEKNPELMNTVEFQSELDKILKKLNENSIDTESKDSTLDETVDFSNMF